MTSCGADSRAYQRNNFPSIICAESVLPLASVTRARTPVAGHDLHGVLFRQYQGAGVAGTCLPPRGSMIGGRVGLRRVQRFRWSIRRVKRKWARTHWVTTINCLGCLPFSRFRAYLGASTPLFGFQSNRLSMVKACLWMKDRRQNRMILSNPMRVGDSLMIFLNSLSSITGVPNWISSMYLVVRAIQPP